MRILRDNNMMAISAQYEVVCGRRRHPSRSREPTDISFQNYLQIILVWIFEQGEKRRCRFVERGVPWFDFIKYPPGARLFRA